MDLKHKTVPDAIVSVPPTWEIDLGLLRMHLMLRYNTIWYSSIAANDRSALRTGSCFRFRRPGIIDRQIQEFL